MVYDFKDYNIILELPEILIYSHSPFQYFINTYNQCYNITKVGNIIYDILTFF